MNESIAISDSDNDDLREIVESKAEISLKEKLQMKLKAAHENAENSGSSKDSVKKSKKDLLKGASPL